MSKLTFLNASVLLVLLLLSGCGSLAKKPVVTSEDISKRVGINLDARTKSKCQAAPALAGPEEDKVIQFAQEFYARYKECSEVNDLKLDFLNSVFKEGQKDVTK